MTDYTRSLVRTAVPLIVGALVGWLTSRGIKVDEATILPAVDSLVAALYYATVRGLESRWPSLGWLLGAPGAPSYGTTTPAPVAPTFVAEPSASEIPAAMMPTDAP